MTNRYQLIILANHYAHVLDTETQRLVKTSAGNVYEALVSEAQWTADALNMGDNQLLVHSLDGSDFDSETKVDPSDFDQAQAEMAQEAISLESRLEPTATLLARLEPMGEDPEVERRMEEKRTVWRMAAYRGGVQNAEKKLREALAALPDTSGNIRARVKLETALSALEVAREVAEDDNPYV